MRYGRNRTPTTMIAKVASVWIISVSVCLPLLVMGFVDSSTVYNDSICAPVAKQVRIRTTVPRKLLIIIIIIVVVVVTFVMSSLRFNQPKTEKVGP